MNIDTTHEQQRADSARSPDVYFDFACPWCYIEMVRLTQTEQDGAPIAVNYRAFQLNPSLPAEGISRETYRVNKFGSLEESQRRDGVVTRAAAAEGISMRFDLAERAPNTRLAHRAIKFAMQQSLGTEYGLRVFQAYFTEGLDIGNPDVLLSLATSVGVELNPNQLEATDSPQDAAIDADIVAARNAGLTGVPFIVG